MAKSSKRVDMNWQGPAPRTFKQLVAISEHRIIPRLNDPSIAVADYSMMVRRGKPQNDANRQEDGKPKEYFHRANSQSMRTLVSRLSFEDG